MINKKEELYNLFLNYGYLNRAYAHSENQNKAEIKNRLQEKINEVKEIIGSI